MLARDLFSAFFLCYKSRIRLEEKFVYFVSQMTLDAYLKWLHDHDTRNQMLVTIDASVGTKRGD